MGFLRGRKDNNIKTALKKYDLKMRTGRIDSEKGFLADACKHDKKNSGATEGGEFLGLLSSC